MSTPEQRVMKALKRARQDLKHPYLKALQELAQEADVLREENKRLQARLSAAGEVVEAAKKWRYEQTTTENSHWFEACNELEATIRRYKETYPRGDGG